VLLLAAATAIILAGCDLVVVGRRCHPGVEVIAGHGGGGRARAGPHPSLEGRGTRRGVREGAVESEKWDGGGKGDA
jgi:hypothetical protein